MRLLLIMFLLVSLFSCKKDYEIATPSQTTSVDFSGTYILNISDSIIDMQHDSIGNPIGVFYITSTHKDTIVISKVASNSFSISNLRYQYGAIDLEAQAQGNVMIINEDWSSTTKSSWLRGELKLIHDSLIVDYKWNHFDTWSTGALPFNGTIWGSGTR